MTEPMSVLHLTGKDPSSGEIKTFDFEIVDEVARRQKADKADTVQETTLSRGRKEGTEVGEASVAFGTDVEASGEGSHAEGNGTIANAPYMYAFGEYNTPAEILPEWVAGTEYVAGDKVIYDGKAYVCDTANSDAEFDPAKWTETEMPEAPVFVIGNGTSENSRGDAFAVERDGDVKAGGDLYTNYDPATGTGKKVATEDYVGDLIGDVVSMEYAVADELPATGEVGTIYLIPNGETSGTDTHDEYIWVPATESFEKIGNTKVDLSDYALKTDTVLNTTLSMGRIAGTTVGENSTALGDGVTASGRASHAEGGGTTASGTGAHAEGAYTQATGEQSHAEGSQTTANGHASHAEGAYTTASGVTSHAEGNSTTASAAYAHAEGRGTIANVSDMHASGKFNQTDPDWAEGTSYSAGDRVVYSGSTYTCKTANSDITWQSSKWNIVPSGRETAFVIGNGGSANKRSNAFVVYTDGGVREGGNTTASGDNSHAEGSSTKATGMMSHAEGSGTTASGNQSHAEGGGSQATGMAAHAEGNQTLASGDQSHAEGDNTIANGTSMHAQGKYNKPDDTVYPDWVASKSYVVGDKVTYLGYGYTCKTANSDATFTFNKWTRASSNGGEIAFVIGNGTSNSNRSNAFAVKWDGTATAAGDIYANDSKKVATEEYVNNAVAGAGGGGSDEYALKTDTVLNTTLSMGRKANTTVGHKSTALGSDVTASGSMSFAEGSNTTASGDYSHAEGSSTKAINARSHAEGDTTTAIGGSSHAEGSGTTASGISSHAEGGGTTASGNGSHAEGGGTIASGNNSHAEGAGTIANVESMHASGRYNKPDPDWKAGTSYAVGDRVVSNGMTYTCRTANSDNTWDSYKWNAVSEDRETMFVVGGGRNANNRYNAFTVYADGSVREGDTSVASGAWSHAEGYMTEASDISHAEGNRSKASGSCSHAEGYETTASDSDSHAEGASTTASGMCSHAEGGSTTASGGYSHAEGGSTTASGSGSHAEGFSTRASGNNSHAEGSTTRATGNQSHAEGCESQATGYDSHAEGSYTIANGASMHAQGKFNKPDDTIWPDWEASKSYIVGDKVTRNGYGYTCKTANSDTTFTSINWTEEFYNGDVAFVIGNGTADDKRSNAFTVKWDGTVQEGNGTTASGASSHAEGGGTTASGSQSHAEGGGSRATGMSSHAEGGGTLASGASSHAEGGGAQATGAASHAEGGGAQATGDQSHAEGGGSRATGMSSHAEGSYTIANGASMHAQGKFNKPDDTIWPDWEASKSYIVGDKVTRNGYGYTCKTANSDATFTPRNWTQESSNGDVAFVIGNGTAENARSNAFAVKWDGTLIMRDVSNGAYYKVYIDGGVLKTEAVV